MRWNAFKVMGVGVLVAAGMMDWPGIATTQAETVYLKRGGTIEGKVVEGESTVEIQLRGGSTTFNKTDILRIDRDPDQGQTGTLSGTVRHWQTKASDAFSEIKGWSFGAFKSAKKKMAGWTQPVGRSNGALAKEKMANDALKSLPHKLPKSATKNSHADY